MKLIVSFDLSNTFDDYRGSQIFFSTKKLLTSGDRHRLEFSIWFLILMRTVKINIMYPNFASYPLD